MSWIICMTASIGLGYINLLQSAKREREENLNMIINFGSGAAAVVVAFAVISLLGANIASGFIAKLIMLCTLYAAVCGITVLVLVLLKKDEGFGDQGDERLRFNAPGATDDSDPS